MRCWALKKRVRSTRFFLTPYDAFELLGVEKTSAQHEFFLTSYDISEWDIFHIKNNQLIILYWSPVSAKTTITAQA